MKCSAQAVTRTSKLKSETTEISSTQWPAPNGAAKLKANEANLFPLDTAGFPGYSVARDGTFVSFRNGVSKTIAVCGGRVSLWSEEEGRMRTLAAGRLAATAFYGQSNGKLRYRDGDRKNLSRENLYWEDDGASCELPDGACPVPGFPGYFVTRDGHLFSTRSRLQDSLYRPLTPSPDGAGYLRVSATDKHGKEKTLKIHRAVIETFVGPPPSVRHQVRHLDGNKVNNCVDNLLWGLPVENASDKRRHGTLLRGSSSPMAKITERDAKKIRDLYATGNFSQAELGRFFSLSKAAIQRICAGQAYADV